MKAAKKDDQPLQISIRRMNPRARPPTGWPQRRQ
jgi:hypothetical protein